MNKNENNNLHDNDSKSQPEQVIESTSITQHSININGEELNYNVTTGTIILKEEDLESGEKQKASIFYIAYTKIDEISS